MNTQKNNKKGFTLIELLVVIAIISMIAAVVIANLSSARSKARNTARLATADQIAKAIQVSTTGANNNQFPSSGGAGLWKCLGKTTCWTSIVGPSLSNLPTLDTVVNAGMAGGVVPVDTFWTPPQWGDTFTYNSNTNPAGGNGSGAYLAWVMENQAGNSCGRGFVFAGSPNGYECMLYLGPPTP